ncbi:MAG: aminotransferase class I/II-fold pyridoxal phosphate-dependent enzyme, partial [Chloroflexota bacterium]
MIRLTIPSIEDDDLQAVSEVLASGYLVQGPRVAAFEQRVAAHVGTKYAVAVSNCTAALHLSLLALDVRAGDLVLVAAYSFPATANVVELCGAQPIFVDIEPDTFNLNPNALEHTLKRLIASAGTAQRVRA